MNKHQCEGREGMIGELPQHETTEAARRAIHLQSRRSMRAKRDHSEQGKTSLIIFSSGVPCF